MFSKLQDYGVELDFSEAGYFSLRFSCFCVNLVWGVWMYTVNGQVVLCGQYSGCPRKEMMG